MIIETDRLIKEYLIDDKVNQVIYTNKLSGNRYVVNNPEEFIVGFNMRRFFTKIEYIKMSDCKFVNCKDNILNFSYQDCLSREWKFQLENTIIGSSISMCLTTKCVDESVVIDSVEYYKYPIDKSKFNWSRTVNSEFMHIPTYWASLGQPVYYDGFFCGVEFPTSDNMITGNSISCKIYHGVEIGAAKSYRAWSAVFGAAIAADMEGSKKSFFEYVDTFARPKRFRIQYNSWYDNMLEINNDNLRESFSAVHEGFKNSGLRDIDCYVVDDGWVDYLKADFWAFNNKFPNGFKEISDFVQNELKSEFGVWVGPRGGYSQTMLYALNLATIGYPMCKQSFDICAANPKYINDLADKMISFVQDNNVSYFKIDGFCARPCRNKNHGHPVGGYQDLYYYTFVWESWYKAFDRIRSVREDVFLNATSYSNLSAWALRWADSIWMNNANDMAYEGEGNNLAQCLNYRDGRYYNLFDDRQLQFPNAYIYNHEPCYATRNFNPPLPSKSHKTVRYTDEEFRQYLMMCMMRGTGFIELYYTPSMLDEGDKWKINAEVMKWAEDNFDILSHSIYFGGKPKDGRIYGYIASNNKTCYIAIRNPKNAKSEYELNVKQYNHRTEQYNISCELGVLGGITNIADGLKFNLEPYEMKIIKLSY